MLYRKALFQGDWGLEGGDLRELAALGPVLQVENENRINLSNTWLCVRIPSFSYVLLRLREDKGFNASAPAVVWMLTKKYNIPSERITEESKGARVQPSAENAENRVTIMIAK